MQHTMTRLLSLLVVLLFFVTACTSEQDIRQQQITGQINAAKSNLDLLSSLLNTGYLKNATLLSSYANALKHAKPQIGEVVDALAQDTTDNGPIYKGLKVRLTQAESQSSQAISQGGVAFQSLSEELTAIKEAADPDTYNMMLTDPINAIADMSDGMLGRVESLSKNAADAMSGNTANVGNQLVGNPNYGQWHTNNNGTSFWEWYGMYALFSNVFSRPIYYSDWSHGRRYSYYNDYGRGVYTSPSQKKAQQTVETTTRNKFKKEGKSFNSPYSRVRAGSSDSVKRKSAKLSKSNTFKSNYSRSSSGSSFNSSYSNSARDSQSRTNRSIRSGK